jgi:hypothetical protein
MKESKFIAITIQIPEGKRSNDTSMLPINLPWLIESIRNEKKTRVIDKRNLFHVFLSNISRRVGNSLRKFVEVIRLSASDIISLQLLEGQMLIDTDKQSIRMGVGQILLLEEGIKHNIMAKEDTVFLLTIDNAFPKYIIKY